MHDATLMRRQFLRFLAASPLCNALAGLETAWGADVGQPVTNPADALDIFDLKATAEQILPVAHNGYLATGVGNEETLRANRDAFQKYYLRSMRLVDVSNIDTRANILGTEYASPIVLSPVSSQGAFHADAELGSARAAKSRGHLQILSTFTSTPIEIVASARGAPIWYQLYPTGRWDITKQLLARAEAAGCTAVVLTVDLPDQAPQRLTLERAIRADTRDCSACHGTPENPQSLPPMFAGTGFDFADFSQAKLTWDFLDRLREGTSMKVLVKGIVTAEDGERCVAKGVDGIIVSNHGGRADESGRGAIDSLAEVAAAVKGRTTILMDSGIRRGTDILKALALGADAVCIGRSYVWGLGSFGQSGVERALELLQDELKIAMQFAGTTSIDAIGSDTIGRH